MGLKGLIENTPLPSSEISVLEACNMMDGGRLGTPVVDEDRLVGVFTYRDLIHSLRVLLEHRIDHLASELDSVTSYVAADGAGGD